MRTQKAPPPQISSLAKVALVLPISLSIIGFISGFISEFFSYTYNGPNLVSFVEGLGWLLIWGAPSIGFFIGIIVEARVKNNCGAKMDKLLAVLGVAIPLILLIIAIKVAGVLRGA